MQFEDNTNIIRLNITKYLLVHVMINPGNVPRFLAVRSRERKKIIAWYSTRCIYVKTSASCSNIVFPISYTDCSLLRRKIHVGFA